MGYKYSVGERVQIQHFDVENCGGDTAPHHLTPQLELADKEWTTGVIIVFNPGGAYDSNAGRYIDKIDVRFDATETTWNCHPSQVRPLRKNLSRSGFFHDECLRDTVPF